MKIQSLDKLTNKLYETGASISDTNIEVQRAGQKESFFGKYVKKFGMGLKGLAYAGLVGLALSGGVREAKAELTGRIAFVSDRDGNNEIYSMKLDGSDQQRLTNDPAGDYCPAFSPDGKKLAFISFRSGASEIYTMNWDGTGLLKVPNSTFVPGDAYAGRAISWSPDGSGFLFTPSHDSLATINVDGTNKRTWLTGGVGVHSFVQGVEWGPTLNDIYFNAQEFNWGYNQHIFGLKIDTGKITQITSGGSLDVSQAPQVSPDGSRIVFQRQPDYPSLKNIFTMNLDGSDEAQLTFDSGVGPLNLNPDWVGGTNEIVVSSNKGGTGYDIWIMDSDGGNLRQLVGLGNDSMPTWTPMPEPATLSLLALGITGLVLRRRR
jgi:TolB protein